jgi:hypothetical protein
MVACVTMHVNCVVNFSRIPPRNTSSAAEANDKVVHITLLKPTFHYQAVELMRSTESARYSVRL